MLHWTSIVAAVVIGAALAVPDPALKEWGVLQQQEDDPSRYLGAFAAQEEAAEWDTFDPTVGMNDAQRMSYWEQQKHRRGQAAQSRQQKASRHIVGVTPRPRYSTSLFQAVRPSEVSPSPPCCSDAISSIACRRMLNQNSFGFHKRCETDADFSLVQCCSTCGVESADTRYAKIFDKNEQSSQCFDRHSPEFCARFLRKQDVWGKAKWSCSGDHAQLAFRICRKTCGFCQRDIYKTTEGTYQPTHCGKKMGLIRH